MSARKCIEEIIEKTPTVLKADGTVEIRNKGKLDKTHSFIMSDTYFIAGQYAYGISTENPREILIAYYTLESNFNNSLTSHYSYYNLVPLMQFNRSTLWTPELGSVPIVSTEEQYFQEMTRTDFKDLELEDFHMILEFHDLIFLTLSKEYSNECREDPQ